jgi:transcriptional regulator with XRE-family HTH domain
MLGKEIRDIRERRGLSQADVAKRAGVSREAIAAIERGERYPNLRTLEGIAECLGVTFVIGPKETHIEP